MHGAAAGQMSNCRNRLSEVGEALEQLAEIQNLADKGVRLRLLLLLSEAECCSGCGQSDILGRTISAVSQQLGKMTGATNMKQPAP